MNFDFLRFVVLSLIFLFSAHARALTFTSANPADGPSGGAACFANGSLDGTQYCGPTGYPAGAGGDFLFAGKTGAGGNVTSVVSDNGLWLTAGNSIQTTIVSTRHIAALNYLSPATTVYLSGISVYQTSGSTQTITIHTFSNTDGYSYVYGAANSNITSTTTYAIPSGVSTAVPISTVAIPNNGSFWVGFATPIVFGINNIQLGTTDTTPPRVTSITRQTPTTSPTNADSVTWRLTFSEAVQNVDASDFSITGTTATLAVNTVSSSVYDVTASGGDLANLNATITLGFVGGQNITDTSSNALANTTPTGTNNNTFVISNDSTSPSVQILQAPASLTSRDPFNVTFEFSEDVTGFAVGDITIGNGSASNFVAVDGNTYTASIAVSGAGNVTIDVPAGVAQDTASNPNTAATQVLVACGPGCGQIATIARTQRVLQNFAGNRVRHITAQGPGLSGFLNEDRMGGKIAGLIDSPVALAFNGSDSGSFSTSLQQFTTFKSGLNADNTGASVKKTIPSPANVWIKGRWSKIKDERGGLDDKTDFGIVYLGADYRYSDDLLVGVMAQADWFDESDAELKSQAEGNGWMFGPYLVARLKDSLTMDLRAAWGQSDNKVSPLGTYWDSYDGERWQVEGNLVGHYKEGKWLIAPALGLNYFKDVQKSYLDSNGFRIPEAATEVGTLSFGPKVTYLADGHDGSIVHPFVSFKGVWDFKAPDIYDISGIANGTEKLWGQFGVGVNVQTAHGTNIQASYIYDGIGIEDYRSHSIELLANISLENTGMPKGSTLSASYALTNILMLQSMDPQSAKVQLRIPFK